MLISRVLKNRAGFIALNLMMGFAGFGAAKGAAFTPGNLVVYRVGAGGAALVNTGNPVFLDEFTLAGVLVQSIAMPTTVVGVQKRLVASGTAGSEGQMTRTADGRFLVMPGYDVTPPAAASLTATASAVVNRVVGRVDALGNVDTSTALTDSFDSNNFRGVSSLDGGQFWVAGNGNSTTGGVRYVAALGAATATQLSTTNNNLRQPGLFGGQLFVSSGSGSAVRLGAVGVGVPIVTGQPITSLPGLAVNLNPNAFFFLDLNESVLGLDTLYVADDGSSSGGVLKFSFNGLTWTTRGSVGVASDAYRGLTAKVLPGPGSGVALFLIRKGGGTATGGGELVTLQDASGSEGELSGTLIVIATAGNQQAFRGIALAPERADLSIAIERPSLAPGDALPVTRKPFTLLIKVRNSGGGTAYGVGGRFTFPVGLSLVSSDASGFTLDQSGSVLSLSGGTLAGGQDAIVSLQVKKESAGALAFPLGQAEVDLAGLVDESDELNNQSAATNVVINDAPDMSLSLTGPSVTLTGMGEFLYALTASNSGAAGLDNASLRFTLPAGLSFVSGAAIGFTVVETGNVVTFSGGDIEEDGTVEFTVRVSASMDGSYVCPVGAAQIEPAGVFDPALGEATASSTQSVTTVVQTCDLAVSNVANGVFQAGELASFSIGVSNVGTGASQGQVTFSSALPPELAATSLTGTGWTIIQGTGGNVSASRLDSLPAGQSYPGLTLNVAVLTSAQTSATATVSVAGGGDSIVGNNEVGATVSIAGTGAGVIAIEGVLYEVNEEAGELRLTLRRSNGRSGAVGVVVNTANGSATSGTDFAGLTNVSVNFADNVNLATVSIPITNDVVAEPNETFSITLSSPTGGAQLGALTTASIRILEPDVIKPKVLITTPKLGQRLDAVNNAVGGEVSDNKQVRTVEVKVNSGGFADATLLPGNNGKSLFSRPMSLMPGENTVTVRAFDTRGNLSDEVERRFVYVVKRPLSIAVLPTNGGTVKLNSTEAFTGLELKRSYELTAKPVAGKIWNGWSSPQLVLTEAERIDTTLRFRMVEGLSVAANFLDDPFVSSVVGDFSGLVRSDVGQAPSHESEGAVAVKVTSKGGFTGLIRIGEVKLPFAGVLDFAGVARFGADLSTEVLLPLAPQAGYVLSFNVDLNPGGTRRIMGELRRQTREGSEPLSIVEANRHGFDRRNPALAEVVGRYNWAMPAQPQSSGIAVTKYPQGDGVGSIRVNSRGIATVVGVLAEGTRVTASAVLDRDFRCPLFLSVERSKGSLNGWLRVDGTRPDSDVTGEALHWFKPVDIKAKSYPFGWPEGVSLVMLGARFGVPVGESVVPDLSDVPGANALLSFSKGGLTGVVVKELRVSVKNVITKSPVFDTSYLLKLNTKSGDFSGSFLHQDGNKAAFKGVILQKGANRRGFGHFLTSGLGVGGQVSLKTKFNPRPTLIVSEFMANNETTLSDEDGAFSDWIEIFNPGADAVDLSDWCLTDSPSNLDKWRFPGVSLGAKQFLLVWASGKNRRLVGQPLHTNFSLSAGGEYLALVRADGSTIEQEFSPVYPAQADDESYGFNFTGRSLLSSRASVRYLVPRNDELGTRWTAREFSDGSWAQGKTGLGFGVGIPGFTVRQVSAKPEFGEVRSIANCDALLALPKGNALILSEANVVAPLINYLGDGGDGNYPNNEPLPNGTAEPYALKATGTIIIPDTGDYVFGLNSDDGGRIKIDGVAVMTDDSNHGPLDNLSAPVNLTAGPHTVEVIMWEGGGGDCVEFFAKAGTDATWNADFKLVGSPGGLSVVTAPLSSGGGPALVVGTNLESAMRTKNASCYVRMPFSASGVSALTGLTLRVRYHDGFIAYLNGTEIVRRNSPLNATYDSSALVQRAATDALTIESIDLSAYLSLLTSGKNVLAVHAMNDTRDDSAFLILPELSAAAGLAGNEVFFRPNGVQITATPGAANETPEFVGTLSPLRFSQPHGFYQKALALAITSVDAGTRVRYTLDGSTPTATNGRLYTRPIVLGKTSIVRAVGFKSGFEPTDVLTQSYFFLDDVIRQSSGGARPSSEWPLDTVNGQVSDYGMDPDIVNSKNPEIGGVDQVKSALKAIPTLSIVTDLPNLFSIDSGIWVNPYGRGEAWERPASIEMIGDSGPGGGFGVNCGLRLRGGFSRSGDNPKHSFRLFFRDRYGAARLNYPLFGEEGAPDFNKIDLRTAQNYSWSFGGDENNTFLREESTREMQGAMGQPYTRSSYYHLYLNGQYWGLYETDERPEANYAESYLGGNAEDYDTVKGEQDQGYITGVTDGNLDAWEALRVKARAHFAAPSEAGYFAISGLDLDGKTRTADPVLLDAENLIDYMLLTFWTGNLDGATSAFLGDSNANNWFAVRNRLGTKGGFKFLAHDFEHTFFNVDEDRTGPFDSGDRTVVETYNPMFLHHDLRPSAEYRMLWADRVQRHLFGQGALRADELQRRMLERKGLLDQVMIAESARWGDAKRGTDFPLTRLNWKSAVDYVINDYVPQRSSRVIAQLREDGLYPSFDAPELSQYGGAIASGAEVVMTGNGGTLYYTLDGNDPRLIGGALNANAQTYVSSSETLTVVPLGGVWKYLADASDQGVSWRAVGFDDTVWPSGAGELGYGDGDEVTEVPFVDVDPLTAGDQKNATTYFRKPFEVINVAGLTGASLQVRYDDAVIVYLNGVEVARSPNISSNAAFNQYASGGAPDENAYFTFTIDPGLIVAGTNVLAAEIHQSDPGSSDISFDASLSLSLTQTPSPLLLTGTGKRTLKVRALQGGEWSALVEAVFDVKQASDLTVGLTPVGGFEAGGTAGYTVLVGNVGTVATVGQVAVTVELPEGLLASGVSGAGWTIVQGTGARVTATREDALATGASFPSLSVSLMIGKTASSFATTVAKVTGGGEINTSNSQDIETTLVTSTGLSELVFSRSSNQGAEVDEGVNVTVLRTGDRSGVASVRLTTVDGSAKAASDYAAQDQVITFADGEISQTVRIGLANDALLELHERFKVKLGSVVGAASLGIPNEANVTILDPDEVAPTVVVATPSEGAKVVSSVAIIKGTARDDKGLGEVEASVNGGAFVKAILSTSGDGRTGFYEVAVPAAAGINAVRVRAIDANGVVSNVATRRFVFGPLRPLTVVVSPGAHAGAVEVGGGRNAAVLEVGKKVRLRAAARAGFRFEGWTLPGVSGPATEVTAIEVVMSEGLTVTARFVADPFVKSAVGSYEGLVKPSGGVAREWDRQGAILVSLTRRGDFTGRLKMGGDTMPFVGLFNTAGASRFGKARLPEVTLPREGRAPLVLGVNWDLGPPHGMQGTVGEKLRDGGVRDLATFVAELPIGVLADGSPYLQGGGRFDLRLLPKAQVALNPADYPQNPSSGLLTILKSGRARVVMNLADGARMTGEVPIQRTMRLPLFLPMYEAFSGGITGEMELNFGGVGGDVQGTDLLWFRPVLNRVPFPFGWLEGITIDGRANAQP